MKPLVAIIGRPNVGKSTMFNRIIGKKMAIVDNIPGVTRDRIYADAEWCGYSFTVIDTGGLEIKSNDEMWTNIKNQAEFAIKSADLILFITDGKTGLVAEDYEVAALIRKSKKPYVVAVNKIDNLKEEEGLIEFYELGIENPISVSADHGKGIGDLLDEIIKKLKEKVPIDEEENRIKIAVVGKPNVGKSSIVNKLLGFERVIVSEKMGTTRDAIDTDFIHDGVKCTLIDTAGIRKKKNVDEDIEYYSVLRALEAVRRADVVLLVFNADEAISEQDVRLAGYVHEQGKPVIVLMNKWDKIEKNTDTMNKYSLILKEELKYMDYFKPIYISALNGQRIKNILPEVFKVFENSKKRITTGLLNDIIKQAISVTEPPTRNGRRLKIYFVTQPRICPPSFIFFVNDTQLVHFTYSRYLENCLRKAVDFEGTPIRLEFKNRTTKNKLLD